MIEVNNITTDEIDEDFLIKIAEIVLKGEKQEKDANVSIAILGQGRMRKINKIYRKKNRVTDVLSFPNSKILKEKFKVGPIIKAEGLGETVICLREVKKNAKKLDSSLEKELARVLIHGILHLLGYDHEKTEAQAIKMREKEEYHLNKII